MLEKKISRRNMLRTTGLAVLGSTFAGLASCAPKKKRGAITRSILFETSFPCLSQCLYDSGL